MKSLKPWLSFRDQLQQLQDRGLHVDDVQAALDYLERLGYYRLSGYWYPLRAIDSVASKAQCKPIRLDTFVTGSRFEDVVKLYVFDKKLRLLALDALERIEMAVRVDVAYLLGQRDALAHMNPHHLHGDFTKKSNGVKTQHELWLEKYESLLQRAKKEPFVAHHVQQYGELPIWAAIEVWDFGLLSKLFAGMKHADRQSIATTYNASDGKEFKNWLRSMNFIRNVSAHHSRLWNINVLELSKIPDDWTMMGMKNARPFFYFCLMQQLLNVICPKSSWGKRFVHLLKNEFPSTAFSIKEFGAFSGWESWSLWK